MTIDILETVTAMRALSVPVASPAIVRSRPPRETTPDSDVLGRIGPLETRIARTALEIDAAQALRFQVFVEEMGARVPAGAALIGRDIDDWDAVCDHLLVLDTSLPGAPEAQIVGTYRLLRQDVADATSGFYSASEFLVDPMIARHPGKRFMELGRSCVLPSYRTKRTVELLWQGNWAYALKHGIDAMFGCASLPGVVPEHHALALSFLRHTVPASGDWAVRARPELYRSMDLMPVEAIQPRAALSALPPLIKGYLRLGAMVGDGAVVDEAFRTTDVLVVLPITNISGRYLNYYGADAARFAL
jgi:putative hemolysin